MRNAWKCLWAAAVVAAMMASGARAEPVEWRIAPAESEIVFEFRSDGEPAEGTFSEFSGTGRFRPEAPSEATFEIRIRSASIDLGDARADAVATSAEWFDSANHPHIVYRLSDLTHLGANRYRARGDLEIRGKTRPVTTTITLQIGEETARAQGRLTVNRRDYGLGVGPISLFVEIGPRVSVRFDLTAHPLD